MTKLEQLEENLRKSKKQSDESFYKALDKYSDYVRVLKNETIERLVIFLFSWSMAGIMFYLGYKSGLAPNNIELTGSASDQSLSFKGAVDFNTIGLVLLGLPFSYMLVRKFKGREKEVYIKER